MARAIGIYGFETGVITAEGGTARTLWGCVQPGIVGNVTIDSTIVRTGVGSLKIVATSGAQSYWQPSGDSSIFTGTTNLRFYIRFTALPATVRRAFIGTASVYHVDINPNGTIQGYNGGSAVGSPSTTALTDTTRWYCIELEKSGTTWRIYIDGVLESSGTANQSMPALIGAQSIEADSFTAYIDDLSYDADSYIGPGRVVLLKPISDNARATLWTGGAGGTTNLWDAVNNTPPIGQQSETNLTQIEHAGGAAGTTDAYDANMTSYRDAGIGPYDKINAVYPMIWCGEDAATGTKTLSFIILSNPTTSEDYNFDVAPTSGALGTFPTGWWAKGNPMGSGTNINKNVSPVMRVIRPETATRVASVCFMGIYVDYTPMGTKSDVILQAVNRTATF